MAELNRANQNEDNIESNQSEKQKVPSDPPELKNGDIFKLGAAKLDASEKHIPLAAMLLAQLASTKDPSVKDDSVAKLPSPSAKIKLNPMHMDSLLKNLGSQDPQTKETSLEALNTLLDKSLNSSSTQLTTAIIENLGSAAYESREGALRSS